MARAVDSWKEEGVLYDVSTRGILLSFLIVSVVSCDDKHKQHGNSASQGAALPPRTRSERSSNRVFLTGDSLEKDIQAAKNLISVKERDKNLVEIAWRALEINSAAALEAIPEISSGNEEKQALIEACIRILLAEERSGEAEAWAASLGNDADTQVALTMIEEILGRSNPEQDALSLTESSFIGEVDPAAEQVIRSWTAKNPVEAVDWLRRMPEGEARTNGLKILLGAWLVRDSSRALSWISSQPTPQSREEAMAGVVGFVAEQPAPIRDTLLEKADEKFRSEILQRIAAASPALGNDYALEVDKVPQPEFQSLPKSGTDDGRDLPDE